MAYDDPHDPEELLPGAELQQLEGYTTEQVRSLRAGCEGAEEAVSYARRLLQGRLDILRAELLRRQSDGEMGAGEAIASLPSVLSGDQGARDPMQARATRLRVPEGAGHYEARLDAIADEPTLADSDDVAMDELAGLIERFAAEERWLSDRRRALFARIDALRAELAARYKDGRADMSEFLGRR